eukprot:7293734-Karenia_brevis.AAC.1
MDDKELARARTLLMAHAPPHAKASLTCKVLLHGDPSWTLAVAPVLAWVEETWQTIASRQGHVLRATELIA